MMREMQDAPELRGPDSNHAPEGDERCHDIRNNELRGRNGELLNEARKNMRGRRRTILLVGIFQYR